MSTRPAPPLPPLSLAQPVVQVTSSVTTTTKAALTTTTSSLSIINGINKSMNGLLLKEKETDHHEYEEIAVESSFRRRSPHRPAPQPPSTANTTISMSGLNIAGTANRLMLGTLGSYTELEGVPFVLNPAFKSIMVSRHVSIGVLHSILNE